MALLIESTQLSRLQYPLAGDDEKYECVACFPSSPRCALSYLNRDRLAQLLPQLIA